MEMFRAADAVRTGANVDPFSGSGGFPADQTAVPSVPPRAVIEGASWPAGEPVEQVPPVPLVRVSVAALDFPDAVTVAAGLRLSVGAARVFQVLHGVACDVAHARAYAVAPDIVTFHLPQSLAALGAGYTTRHLRRLLPELVTAGLIDWGAHASKVGGMSLWDGCLWAIKVRAGVEVLPHLRRDEWRHEWRDFAGDIEAGNTVKAVIQAMSQLHSEERENAVKSALKTWVVNPGNVKTPLLCSWDMAAENGPGRVQDIKEIVYRLGELPAVHPTKRAGLVGRLASSLAGALDDRHSRRWYCAVIWEAFRTEGEGRGGLQVLMAALLRLDADRREWEGLRSPGALLAFRLKAS